GPPARNWASNLMLSRWTRVRSLRLMLAFTRAAEIRRRTPATASTTLPTRARDGIPEADSLRGLGRFSGAAGGRGSDNWPAVGLPPGTAPVAPHCKHRFFWPARSYPVASRSQQFGQASQPTAGGPKELGCRAARPFLRLTIRQIAIPAASE